MVTRGCAVGSCCWLIGSLGCGPTEIQNTGGTNVEPGLFGRGVITVNQNDNYDATNTSLVGVNGAVLSESLLSKGLSGDVTAPTMPSFGTDIVLLDRYPSLIHWVNVKTGELRSQFHADSDGLAQNPWDYIPISNTKAYVVRYDGVSGTSTHGDVIVVNPQTANVTSGVEKRVDVATASAPSNGFSIHPARGVVVNDTAYVVSVVASPSYEYAPSKLIVINTTTDEVEKVIELSATNCNALALSPNRDKLGIACAGDLLADEGVNQGNSALIEIALNQVAETWRLPAKSAGNGVFGFSITYASQDQLLALFLGNVQASVSDQALSVNVATNEVAIVASAPPVQLGGVLCPLSMNATSPTPPETCFVSNASNAELLRFTVETGAPSNEEAITVDTVFGLPPRGLGQF
ncbi:MAG: hypothetical protein IPK82_16210 [Polyangiaceae bacterium]|nr:hypothetical protein [Polyangiaceae bacterium]